MSSVIHFKFDSCTSTQDLLIKKDPEKNHPILISSYGQTQGRGQYGRQWVSENGNLFMSFTYPCHTPHPTLTSLELAVLIRQYFYPMHELKLKWPNDLYYQGKKLGGILCQMLTPSLLLVGLGINTVSAPPDIESNSLSLSNNCHEMANSLYRYLLDHRKNSNEIKVEWENQCVHLNQKVTLKTTQDTIHGIFRGIGSVGQALIETTGKITEFYSGSLSW